MPTGYTAGIIDGTTKTFKEYATKCIRAFGAAIHMRDDSWDKPYEERKVSDYHIKALKEAEKQMKKLNSTTDEQLIKQRVKELEEEIKNTNKSISEKNDIRSKLEDIKNQAELWTPPTEDHISYKEFMIKQIDDTISFDCNLKYDLERLIEYQKELDNLDPVQIRKNKENNIQWSIDYHTKEMKADQKRTEESNKWVKDVLNSL